MDSLYARQGFLGGKRSRFAFTTCCCRENATSIETTPFPIASKPSAGRSATTFCEHPHIHGLTIKSRCLHVYARIMLNSRMNSSLVVVSPQHVDTIGNASTCRRDLLLLGNPSSTRSLCSNNPARMQRQSGIRDMSVLEGVIAMPHLANHDFYSMKNRRSASIRS